MDIEKEEIVDACVYFCYILGMYGELSESVIGEIILSVDQQEYFDVMGNIGFMLDKGLIGEKIDPGSGEKIYYLRDEGRSIANDLSSHLSPMLKEKTVTEGKAVLSKNERERSVRCDINYDRKKDRYDLHVKFLNELNGETIIDLTLYAPDEKKALEMRERFLSDPSYFITRILNMFIKDDLLMSDK